MFRQTNPIEKQANDFAMQLLMPEDMVRKAVNEGSFCCFSFFFIYCFTVWRVVSSYGFL